MKQSEGLEDSLPLFQAEGKACGFSPLWISPCVPLREHMRMAQGRQKGWNLGKGDGRNRGKRGAS